MLTLPTIIERVARPYVAIKTQVSMDTISRAADELFPELFAWLTKRGVTPTGAAFFKYNVIDMRGIMELELGAQVPEGVTGDERVAAGVLPAGRYGQVIWTGHYRHLIDVNAVLIGWAKENGIQWDAQMTPKGEAFVCRLEIYETDPREEPDPDKWVTELIIKLAD